MMRDYEYLFAMNVQQKLKDMVKARVYCKINPEDELYVEIEDRDSGIGYYCAIPGFSQKMLNGYTSEYAAYEVVKAYKNHIIKRFFK